MERRVAVFFYGSFMDREVLRQRGFEPADLQVAKLWGFDIRFRPLATIEPVDQHTCVYGLLATATHADLQRLYGEGMAASYRPEAREFAFPEWYLEHLEAQWRVREGDPTPA